MQQQHPQSSNPQAFSRRAVIKAMGLGAATAATAAFTPSTLGIQAQSQTDQASPTQNAQANPNQPSDQSSEIITKEIPRTNERIPAIGLVVCQIRFCEFLGQ